MTMQQSSSDGPLRGLAEGGEFLEVDSRLVERHLVECQIESERTCNDPKSNDTVEWDHDLRNPLNWPARKKMLQLLMLSLAGLSTSVGSSIISPARGPIMEVFHVSSTAATLPLSLYVLALGFGPVLGGPLSETIGRYPVYLIMLPLGALFTLGAGFTNSFAGLCILRFLAGFFWAPALAIATGSLSETFQPKTRGPASAVFILMPFLGTGLGPPIGSFTVIGKDYQSSPANAISWTQWTLLFFAIPPIIAAFLTEETFHPMIQRRIAKERGEKVPDPPPLKAKLRQFAVVALLRPIRMLFLEPIVASICLYVSVEFGVLFSFLAAVPYTFETVYKFTLEQSGMVFFSILVGCVLAFATITLCDRKLYHRQITRYPLHKVPPEHRLYPAMVGSVGLPLGLFWFAWTARRDISWASPAVAIVPFSWGNLCLFVGTLQYITDTYHGNVVASAASANSLARYAFAGVFPLFTLQIYEALGINWASSLLGFVSLALMPIPWVLFKYGPRIRAKSHYETVKYE